MKIMAIDGNSIVNRAFYGVRPLTNRQGLHTNAIYGFLSIYFKLMEEERPDGVCVAFDLRAPTFRHQLYEGYKAQRKGMPDELAEQMEPLKQVLDALGVLRLECEGHEADDILGTVSHLCAESGDACVIVTGDRDSFQLLQNAGTQVLLVSTRSGRTETVRYGREELYEKYQLPPEQMVDLKALMGDASDNIPGVAGIGEKTALDLVRRFGAVADIYENLDALDIRDSVKKKLREGRDSAFLSYKLGTIEPDAPVDFAPADARCKPRDDQRLAELLTQLEFKTYLARLGLSPRAAASAAAPADTGRFEVIRITSEAELDALTERMERERAAVCVPEEMCAAALCFGEECAVVFGQDFADERYRAFLKRLFSDKVQKIYHDCKPVLVELINRGEEVGGFVFDTALGAYVLDPTARDFGLPACASVYAPELPAPDPARYADDDVYSALTGCDEALGALAAAARAVHRMHSAMDAQLTAFSMHPLYYEIELPLCRVLAEMQVRGMAVDEDALSKFGDMLSARLETLAAEIYGYAAGEFNILSTRQLGTVLFDQLGLPPVKKTKTGYSTDIDVLEKLKDQHPIVPALIEYRQYSKLKSTYTDGLAKVISPKDGRIHSSFNQMITATGRISSTDPNLQNIPVRTELGGEVRRMFVPGRQGWVFVDADYSQIELRILAHIADDRTMQEAFRTHADIHTATAAQVFNVPVEQVDAGMRRAAKAVNFGIVYGISEFSLAEDIGVSRAQAKAYIESYLEKYAGVRMYMKDVVERAHRDGFVTTLLGRRRNLPELQAKNYNIRSFGERVALNAPIQGTAADIIKIAMLRVSEALEREGFEARLVLQVHDELIVESPAAEAEAVAAVLTREMEGAYSLSVPLEAEAGIGDNWYDAKK